MPARRDNRTGAIRVAGQGWASEIDASVGFVGEDACGDTADFAIDFDDRGADSNGTDWGEDDGAQRCGRSGVGAGQWFVYAREVRGAALGRVALLGPTGLQAPLAAAGFDVASFTLDALPADIDLSDFDVVF
ncbi:MAG: hypothetical protein ACI9U2_003716 [Bradymonadia bacterium]